jgi:ATP-dependent helicase/nuclease subunit A
MADERLTPEQKRAIETLDGDLILSAGAGTGKTRVLTWRFIHIIDSKRAAVDEILTLTFTEKAAREMKERIVRRFEQLGREQERRQVETAYISNVHSFCMRVLRENALEAGVDPYFVQLDEADAQMLQSRAFDEVIRRAHADNDADILALVFDYGKDLEDMVLSLYGRMRSLGRAPAELQVAAPQDLTPLAAQAAAAIEAATALDGRTSTVAAMIDAAHDAHERIEAALRARDFDWLVYAEISELAGIFGAVRAKAEKPVADAAKEALLAFGDALLAQHASARATGLRSLLTAFDETYQALKDRDGSLDFDDLLTKTRDLFGTWDSPSPTALRYRNQFKFFLMDEFQDTNQLQWSVVEPITDPERRFTVGDAKQSIYRFLYADVGVFQARARELAEHPGALDPLAHSFRSHPELLNFANAFFDELWADDDFSFGPLEPGRKFGTPREPRVEVLVAGDRGSARDNRRLEAELIARRIAHITGHGDGEAMMLTEEGEERAVRFGDVMILFRATGNVQLYEDALAEQGIPYYTVSGRGFFRTQEVQDLRNLLSVIENPMDDLAMAAVLRSPLVGVSDEALYWLGAPAAREEQEDDALAPQATGRIAASLERLDRLTRLRADDHRRLEDFRKLYEELRQSALSTSIADLLDDAIRRTEYDLKILCQRNGRRRYANVEKLRQIALGFQERSLFDLRDFLDYLETLETVAERETEAPTEAEEADVVRLMTIHQAKGLESPVVILADLSLRPRGDSERAHISSSGELATKVRDVLGDTFVAGSDYARLDDEAKAADFAEDKRLFYVACTRAKEYLLLSGCVLGEKAANSAKPYNELKTRTQWITKFFGITELPPPEGHVVERDGFTALLRSDVPGLPSDEKRRRPLLQRFRAAITAGETLDILAIAPGCDVDGYCRSAHAVSLRIGADASRAAGVPTLAVTALTCYRQCPRLYELTIVKRLPEDARDLEPAAIQRLDREDYDDPRDRGTRLHDLLFQAKFNANRDEELNFLTTDLTGNDHADARQVLARFWESDLRKRMAAAGARGDLRREIPFVVRIGNGLLRGQIDALVKEGDDWSLVDYKTGGRHDEEHRRQVTLYALACRELLGVTPECGIICYLDLDEAPQQYDIHDADLEAASGELAAVIERIAAGDFAPQRGPACKTCAFISRCNTNT